jgi:hypothetical protein
MVGSLISAVILNTHTGTGVCPFPMRLDTASFEPASSVPAGDRALQAQIEERFGVRLAMHIGY